MFTRKMVREILNYPDRFDVGKDNNWLLSPILVNEHGE
jgi:hypothetical protein